MEIIKVEGLSKCFSYYEKEEGLKNSFKNLFLRKKLTKTAVSDVSFTIEEGEIVGFLGPNGAGKTTTLKMLSGILFPTKGTATVLGYVPWQTKNELKKQFSIVMGQKNQLWWDLPANESFLLNKYIYDLNDKDYRSIIEELSELLDVKELLKTQVRNLSLGERMKMELIVALIHRPKVLFLDEPTIGLDIVSQRKIRDFLKYYNQQSKTTIILTSHYMKDIEDLCKRTIVINHGSVIYNGDINKINETMQQKKIIKIQMKHPIHENKMDGIGHIREFNGISATIEVEKENLKKLSIIILERFDLLDFNIEDIPLEESMELLFKKVGKT